MSAARQAFERAAAATLDRVRRDADSAPAALRPLLGYLVRHLFDPALCVKAMFQACGLPASSGGAFKAWCKEDLRSYYSRHRLETAATLLGKTDIPAWRIAHLAGYSGQRAFGNAFRRWSGETPTAYRCHAKATNADRLTTARALALPRLRRAMAGGMEEEEVRQLIARIAGEDGETPQQNGSHPKLEISLDGDTLAHGVASAVWASIEEESYAFQLESVRACRSPALFDLLCRESRRAGRLDRRRGVELMELALASLEGCSEILGDELTDRQALGWARLGNARRLHLDYKGAEQAFATAEAVWRQPRATRDPLVEGQVYDLKATLRWFQRRFAEALALEDRAIGLFREYEAGHLLAEAIVVRGSIRAYAGDPTAGITDLEAARGLAGLSGRLCFAIEQNLAWFHLLAGDTEAAARILARARGAWAAAGGSREWLHLRWVEALVDLARGEEATAERGLAEVYAGYQALGESGHAAAGALDLAILCEAQGRTVQAAAWAGEALPVFESFGIHREALAAFDLLREAVAADRLTAATLRQAREYLGWLCQAPLGRLPRTH